MLYINIGGAKYRLCSEQQPVFRRTMHNGDRTCVRCARSGAMHVQTDIYIYICVYIYIYIYIQISRNLE